MPLDRPHPLVPIHLDDKQPSYLIVAGATQSFFLYKLPGVLVWICPDDDLFCPHQEVCPETLRVRVLLN